MMFVAIFAILALTAHFPISWRPERVFLRLLRRYFRSCQHLISTLGRDPGLRPTRQERRMQAFHLREVSTIPAKLAGWAPHIGPAALADTPAGRVQDLIADLRVLSARLRAMQAVGGQPQADVLAEKLRDDLRTWKDGMISACNTLSASSGAGGGTLRDQLAKFLDHLEERIRTVMDDAADGESRERDAERLYRLLGAYRGVSQALVAYQERTDSIDWERWRDARF